MLQVFYKWCAHRVAPVPTVQDLMKLKADELFTDTIRRELELIDAQHSLLANKAKAKFLLENLDQTKT